MPKPKWLMEKTKSQREQVLKTLGISELTPSVDNEKVRDAVKAVLVFDIEKAREGAVDRFIDDWGSEGGAEAEDQYWLPEFPKPRNLEPGRLIEDNNGNSSIERVAPPNFFIDRAKRSETNRNRVDLADDILQAEAKHYSAWHIKQLAAGRDALQLTWPVCVRETLKRRPRRRRGAA
jgi:hypothetical protein